MKLARKTVLITGGASGIGYALAQRLVQMNNEIVVVGRDSRKLEAVRLEVPQLTTLRYDISIDEDRVSLADWIGQNGRQLDVLINNAGVQNHSRFDEEPPPAELIRHELETNFVGPVRLSSLLIPHLRSRPEAAIVNISSGLAIAPKASAPVYCASKAALSSFTRALRYQLEQTPIQVYDVLAPLVDTSMTKGRGRGKMSPDRFAVELIRGIERGRFDIRVGKTKLLYALHRMLPILAYRITKEG